MKRKNLNKIKNKRNKQLRHEKTWNNLKYILLSARSQFEKPTHCMILII